MQPFLRIFTTAKSLWPYYAVTVFGSVLSSVLVILSPFVTKFATDYIVEAIRTGQFNPWMPLIIAGLMFGLEVIGGLVRNVSNYFGDVMTAKLHKILSERYYEQLLSLPQKYFDEEMSGTIINRLSRTIHDITQFINMLSNNLIQMVLTTVFVIVSAAIYSWQVAILLALIFPVYMWLTARSSKKWVMLQGKKNKNNDIATGRFGEVVSQIRVVKSFRQERHEYRQFTDRYQKVIDITRPQSRHWHVWDMARTAGLAVLMLLAFYIIFAKTLHREITIGEMVFMMQLITMVRMPLFGMSYFVESAQRAAAGSKDYFDVMELSRVDEAWHREKRTQYLRGDVVFDHVDFGYSKDKQVLHDVCVEIPEGKKVALVGESGEGKTTLTNLLMKLYSPTAGTITIGSKSIDTVPLVDLRESVGVVFQDPALFSGTIRENIAYGRPDATLDEVTAAAKAANAEEFIAGLEKGYDTLIGERGLKLSGGQKQRIAIARALLKDAPILILDEATSSLDSKSERLVQAALKRLMKNRTTIIIAHRLSTIADVDMIITLRGGRVDEIGSPKQLAKSGGIYAKLLSYQNGTDDKDKKALAAYEIESK